MNSRIRSLFAAPLPVGKVLLALASALFVVHVRGETPLATAPFTSEDKVNALPNVMFILDDSSSMGWDFLPDWADPDQNKDADAGGVYPDSAPAFRFRNASYNGIAYDPGIRYRPPSMFDSAGAVDTTTYPSMNGTTTASGGDSNATVGSPNWKAVKKDAYGVQSTDLTNLEGAAYFYTTVAGEFCTDDKLRTCSDTKAGAYVKESKLRWCNTQAQALATTAVAGTNCQASNIADDGATNDGVTSAGVTTYMYARTPEPRKSRITFSSSGTVTNLTVDGLRITAGDAVGGDASALAAAVAAQINLCKFSQALNCTAVGYSAVSLSNEVTVTAPAVPAAAPVVTGVVASVTAFAGNSVPGSILLTVIRPTLNSYPYPGTAAKHANRSDCAGATCTYAEEMTNYANWYAYYRTRMQAMKSAASRAFAGISDKFRVGYYSVNNGTGSDFLNISVFSGSHKYDWYRKFMLARPFGATPTRGALAAMGRMYANKQPFVHGSLAVSDPMQYSCQQNYAILSTDGYWTDNYVYDSGSSSYLAGVPQTLANATQEVSTDTTNEIGQQDGSEPRPYYDGAKYTRTESQILQSLYQVGANVFTRYARTLQRQIQEQPLTEVVTTTETYPKTLKTWQLETQTTPLNKTEYALEQKTYPLGAMTKNLEEKVYRIRREVRPLERYTYNLINTPYSLEKHERNIDKYVSPLEKNEQKINRYTYQLQIAEIKLASASTKLRKHVQPVMSVTNDLQETVTEIKVTSYALQRNKYQLVATDFQLQKRSETSSNGGETWVSTGWVNVTSGQCEVRANGPGYTRNTECQYVSTTVPNLDSCSNGTPVSAGSPYTVLTSRVCAYQTTPTTTAVPNCTKDDKETASPFTDYSTCTYSATATVTNNQTTCSAKNEAGAASMTGDKVVCEYEATAKAPATVTECTATTTNTAAAVKRTCAYKATANTATYPATCTNNDQSANAAGTKWTGNKVTCSYDTTKNALTFETSCSPNDPGSSYNAAKVVCSYSNSLTAITNGTFGAYTLTNNCPYNDQTGSTSTWNGDRVLCQYDTSTPTWSDASSDTCARRPQDTTNYSNSQIRCRYKSTADTLAPADTGLGTCSEYSQSMSGTSAFTFTGDKKTCAYDGNTSWTGTTTCTKRDPGTLYNDTKVSCRYGAESTTPTSETTCTAKDAGAANLTDRTGTTTGDKVRCVWQAWGAWGSTPSCTWNNPATPSSTGRECRYVAGTPLAAAASCTPNPLPTVTTDGTVWSGDKNTCTYAAAVVDTNLPTCDPSGTNNGTNQYTTCGYGAIVATNNLTSCTVDAPEPGPSYTGGSTTACFYQAAAYSTTVTTSCTQVPQAADFSAPQVTCTYATAVPSTNLANCTDKAESVANPFEGPAKVCSYAATPSSTLEVTACAANRNTASPYTGGAAVDCAYKATGVTTNNVASCQEQAQTPTPGPNYVGPQRVCTYGTASGWSDVTSGQCDVVTKTGPTFQGPARECQYRALADACAANTCTDLNQSTGPASYTVLLARQCVSTPCSTAPTTATNTVDNCSTSPTSVTNGAGVITATTTTCAYQTGTAVNAASCVERAQDAGSPYSKAVVCPISDTTAAVAPDCTAAGALPDVFDVTGKIVVCSRTDVTGTEGVPEPVSACTNSVNGAKQQTVCTPLIDEPNKPVSSCMEDLTPSAPYLKRTCTPVSTSTTTMGCKAETAADANAWRTVTCTPVAGTGTKNTLADVAIYFYNTDLRTSALGNCTGAVVPPATTGNSLCSNVDPDPANNVPTTTTDTKATQHMTTFTLGLGASGYMKYSSTYEKDSSGDFVTVKGNSPYAASDGITADPGNGVCSWQAAGHCNWPYPDVGQQTTIDDLWHAGVNGRGGYFNASDPAKLGEAIVTALGKVEAAGGAAAAPTISSPRLSPADNYIFASTYTSADWTGEVRRYQIDPFSGVVSTEIDWAVQGKLDLKASRNIYVFDNSVVTTKLKAFTSANFGSNAYFNSPHISTAPSGLSQFVCATDEPCLSSADQANTAAAGANLVKYLAGDRTYEGPVTNNATYYRERQHVLGDMVNAQVVYVTKPLYEYGDPGYSDFKTNQASRKAVVYAGANDGMLHAFAAKGSAATEALVEDAATKYAAWYKDPLSQPLIDAKDASKTAANSALGADTTVGQELWAFIPSFSMPHLYKLADKLYRNSGKHRYFIDATPVVGDICASSCGTGSAVWKTILVGGLGRGGRGYYALDVTDPASPKALWEFTHEHLGYSYGNPQIAKLSNGKWVVLVTSGYNNIPNDDGTGGDGVGRLYVLDAVTGAEVAGVSPISTGVGSVSDPSGLSKIVAQVRNPAFDNTIVAVYGGDLLGNLWRFDVNGDIGAAGIEAQLLATLMDGTTAPTKAQPITSKPEVGIVDDHVVVFVGTGRLLAGEDIADASLQTLYAIKDTGAGTASPQVTPVFDNPGGERTSNSPSNVNAKGFVRQIQSEIQCPTGNLPSVCVSGQTIVTSTNYPVNFATQNGWFVDVIHGSERISTDPVLGLGVLAFNTNVPSLLACDVDGKSYSYELDYRTGGPLYFPGNGNATDNNGSVGKLLANSFASSPALVVTQSGELRKISGTPGGIISESTAPPPGITPARRTSWRELIEAN